MRTNNTSFTRLFPIVLGLLLGGCSDQTSVAASGSAASVVQVEATQPADTIARVGDEVITFSQLNTMLNSSAMVGLSIPALGTPERNQTIITLLDKVISANLLYLDARDKGTDRQEPYVTDLRKYEEAILASMYKTNVLIGDLPVSEEEVQAFYASSISPETELTGDVKLAIEASLRNKKLEQRNATLRERLREGTEITIDAGVANPDKDSERSATDVVATIGERQISWGEVEPLMRGADYRATLAPFYIDNEDERMKRLQQYIDNELMVSKARAAGMDRTPEFIDRTAEYRKTHLINVHREQLIQDWMPSDEELQDYYLEHMDSITTPERRKVQMVVLKTKEEAEAVKAQIDSGEITMFQAAQQYSIDPNAKHTLGDMGWVSHGTGFKELDDFTFSLEPEVVGGPVESPAGWHLVKVLEVIDARYQNFDDTDTRKRTLRMYMKEKKDAYVVDLRKSRYEVVVYNDELTRRFQQEADMIAELNKKAVQEGSVTKQRQEELQKYIVTPPQD